MLEKKGGDGQNCYTIIINNAVDHFKDPWIDTNFLPFLHRLAANSFGPAEGKLFADTFRPTRDSENTTLVFVE